MGAGEGTIKKLKKSKAGGDASSKKLKGAKKKKGKGGKKKSKISSGGSTTDDEYRGTDAGSLAKPQKLNQTCITSWSEPTTCCVDLIDKSTSPCPPPCGDAKCRDVCLKLVKKEMGDHFQDQEAQARLCIERLSNERDYYRAEFERLIKFFEKLGSTAEDEEGIALGCIACQKKQQMIEYLQKENELLSKEKLCLMSRLEEGGGNLDSESPTKKCCRSSCKRIEREKDLLKLDVQRLEQEGDCLREKFKIMSENKTNDYAKFQTQRGEFEMTIRKLEGEKKELIKSQGLRRVQFNALEEKVDMYVNLLRNAQEEIHRIKTQYCQLKKLHTQCDAALLDTQNQLLEVEAQLVKYQNKEEQEAAAAKQRQLGYGSSKSNNKEAQVYAPPCSCTDAGTQPEEKGDAPETSEEDKATIKQLDEEKDELLNQLDMKTELLCQCQEENESKDDLILRMKQEIEYLQEEIKDMEGEMVELKLQCDKSAMVIEEKETAIKNLQTDNEQKQTDVKKIQTVVEEKVALNKSLQAEVEHLSKETFALATSNHLLQTETYQSKIQISVAIETVTELENKTKQLEEVIEEYEHKIRLLKNDIEDCRTQMNRKEIEINNLLKNKNNFQNLSEELDVENRAHEKTIVELKCKCDKLESDLTCLGSKEQIITDLMAETDALRAEKDILEKENAAMKKKVNKLENKLFQCICTICDTTHDKCSMMNCIFKEYSDISKQCEKLFPKAKDIGIQTIYEQSLRDINTSTKSIKQVMAAVPLRDEQSSRAITSRSTLPIPSTCQCKRDTIISSLYQSVDTASPFTYKQSSDIESQNKIKSPLNVIVEESSTGTLNENEEEIEKIDEFKQPILEICPEVEERQKYVIDNVTSICKIIQVGTEERFIRRTRLDSDREMSKLTYRSSFRSPKNS
ncbi:testis-specific gene 10 protein-like isoform X1 [Harmonia axyridis]|uniref:testis-specific gene 10 protein-like isoform X1 n=1 Tax=Harmonia axyridis TaxID=115357 RepID=UPI001E27841A|nr:testis-specific gene 10 protein-like isoform X1 [Harmonia axyridis]